MLLCHLHFLRVVTRTCQPSYRPRFPITLYQCDIIHIFQYSVKIERDFAYNTDTQNDNTDTGFNSLRADLGFSIYF